MKGRSLREIAHDVYERELSAQEFDALLDAARQDGEERENKRALIAWFQKRYPTVQARLAYARNHALALRRTREGA